MNKSNSMFVRHGAELAMYEKLSKEIDLKLKKILIDNPGHKDVFMEENTYEQNQMEYDGLVMQTNRRPKKAVTAKRLDELNKKVQKLNVIVLNNLTIRICCM